MKVKAEIWYPEFHTIHKDIEVDVPEGKDPDEYLQENAEEIILSHADVTGLRAALDVDYAGIKIFTGGEG